MTPPDDHDSFNRRRVLQGLSAGAVGAWISPLFAGSKTMPDSPADLILYNGRLSATPATRQTRRTVKSSVMPMATRPAC